MLKSVLGHVSVQSRTTVYPIEKICASADGYLELQFQDGSIFKAQYQPDKRHWNILIDRDQKEKDTKAYLANLWNEKFDHLSEDQMLDMIKLLEASSNGKQH